MKPGWKVKSIDEDIRDTFSRVLGIDKYLSAIILAKGQNTISDAYDFLNPRLSSLNSPFLMKGMYEAVGRIREASIKEERVAIFADSDLDGLTSLSILLNLFEKIGVNSFFRYAVLDEEYGLRHEVIDELREGGADLLVTLDCGVRDIDEIAYARSLGIDVIVCDHHEQGDELPDAIVVNPKRRDCPYPFKELAGVGVAFKLCHGFLMSYLQSFNKKFLLITADPDNVYLLYIRNGIVEGSEILRNIEELGRISGGAADIDYVVHYDAGGEKIIREVFPEKNIYNLNDLVASFCGSEHDKRVYSLDELCDIFSITREVFKNKGEVISRIFSEIEYNHSPKIDQFINSTIDLVSLGTIADIMPVRDENRIIVHHGIKSFNSTSHPGLAILANRIGDEISAKNIAWKISPLLNTPSRFGRTDITAKFFIEKDTENIQAILSDIDSLNTDRKKLINDLLDGIYADIKCGKIDTKKKMVWIESVDIPDGLTGLIANRISESLSMPVIIISMNGNKEHVKGSGRAVGDFNFFACVEPLSSLFEKIGGHPCAFGFTANANNLERIREKVEQRISGKCRISEDCHIDLELPLDAVSIDFINNLAVIEPCGHQNEECVFLTRCADLKEFKRFGNDKNHGKYTFIQNNSIEAIGWNMADVMEKFFDKKRVDILYRLENNEFNGRVTPRMYIMDLD